MDVYDIAGACERVRDHAEALTNWYVRRSRDRFWDGDADAIDTLHTVLEVTARRRGPAAAADHGDAVAGAHRRPVGAPGRLARRRPRCPRDDALVATMERVRQVASAALSLRKARGLRVRLPLAALTVAAPDAATLAPFADILRDEVNVKDGRPHRGRRRARPVRARRQRAGLRAAAGRRHPEGDPRGQGGRVDGRAGRHGRPPPGSRCCRGSSPSGWSRWTPSAPPRCPATPAWWCWTPWSRRSWPPRARRATSSGWCSRRAATPASTCPTGSRSPWTPRRRSVDGGPRARGVRGRRGAGHDRHLRDRWPQPAHRTGAVTAADGTSTQVEVLVDPSPGESDVPDGESGVRRESTFAAVSRASGRGGRSGRRRRVRRPQLLG